MAVAKEMPDITADAYLDFIAECDEMYVCSGSSNPGTRAAVISAALVTIAMTPGDGSDYAIADDTNGRKITTVVKNAQDIDATDDATCVVLCKASDTSLRWITTCTLQNLTIGGTVDIPAWKINLQDPT